MMLRPQKLSAQPDPGFPARYYEIILADPPWEYYGDPNKDQAAGKHYNMMSDDALKALPVQKLCYSATALFMWATCPRLDSAIDLMRAWGFHYRGVAYQWIKTTNAGKIINGQGVRPSFVKPTTELVLVGSTNKTGRTFPLLNEGQAQVILAPRPEGVHSRKPVRVREAIVELLGDRPRIELFARDTAPGWDCWGNEAPKGNNGNAK